MIYVTGDMHGAVSRFEEKSFDKLRSGDILMLCSDGVTNTLSESDIAAVIKENSDDVYRCCKEINQSVSKKNNAMQDNSTVVIIQYAE